MTTAIKYKPYSKYKPSGTDWIGEVPGEWEIKRLRYYFDYHAGGVWGGEENGNGNNISAGGTSAATKVLNTAYESYN